MNKQVINSDHTTLEKPPKTEAETKTRPFSVSAFQGPPYPRVAMEEGQARPHIRHKQSLLGSDQESIGSEDLCELVNFLLHILFCLFS